MSQLGPFRVVCDRDLSSGSQPQRTEALRWSPHMDVLAVLACTPDGAQQILIQRCGNKWENIHVLEMASLLGPTRVAPQAMDWTADGDFLVVGLSDGRVAAVDVESGRLGGVPLQVMDKGQPVTVVRCAALGLAEPEAEELEKGSALKHAKEQRHLDERFAELVRKAQREDEKSPDDDVKRPHGERLAERAEEKAECVDANTSQDTDDPMSHPDPSLWSFGVIQDCLDDVMGPLMPYPRAPRVDFKFSALEETHGTMEFWMKRHKALRESYYPTSFAVSDRPYFTGPTGFSIFATPDGNVKVYCGWFFNVASFSLFYPRLVSLPGVDRQLLDIHLSEDLRVLSAVYEESARTEDGRIDATCKMEISTQVFASRRDEIVTVANRIQRVFFLLQQLEAVNYALSMRWRIAFRSFANKVASVKTQLRTFGLPEDEWRFHLRHLLAVGVPSAAMLQFIEKDLSMASLTRCRNSFAQFVDEMTEIIHYNAMRALEEITYQLEFLRGMSDWNERYGFLGLDDCCLQELLDLAAAALMRLHTLDHIMHESKRNLESFLAYLVYLVSVHGSESDQNVSLDDLDLERVYAAFDLDLEPSRVSLMLSEGAIPWSDIHLFDRTSFQDYWDTLEERTDPTFLGSLNDPWEKHKGDAFASATLDLTNSWKEKIGAVSAKVPETFRALTSTAFPNATLGKVDQKSDCQFRVNPASVAFTLYNQLHVFAFSAEYEKRGQVRDHRIGIAVCKYRSRSVKPKNFEQALWTNNAAQFDEMMRKFLVETTIEGLEFASVKLRDSRRLGSPSTCRIAHMTFQGPKLLVSCLRNNDAITPLLVPLEWQRFSLTKLGNASVSGIGKCETWAQLAFEHKEQSLNIVDVKCQSLPSQSVPVTAHCNLERNMAALALSSRDDHMASKILVLDTTEEPQSPVGDVSSDQESTSTDSDADMVDVN